MAVEGRQDVWPFKAGADLSSNQYQIVKLDASGNIVLAGAGDKAIGILTDAPVNGQYGSVAIAGITKVAAGAAVAAGDYLSPDANGKAVKATDTAVSDGTVAGTQGTHIIGQALSAAGAADELVTVVLGRGLS